MAIVKQASRTGLETAKNLIGATLVAATQTSIIERIGRFARSKSGKFYSRNCAYCGTSVHSDPANCVNCGAAISAPPPPPAPRVKGTKTIAYVATIALWSIGGFLGLHCYAAGRHLRGLLYGAAFMCVFFYAVSVLFDGARDGSSQIAVVTAIIGINLMWAYDGVQIIRGRFAR